MAAVSSRSASLHPSLRPRLSKNLSYLHTYSAFWSFSQAASRAPRAEAAIPPAASTHPCSTLLSAPLSLAKILASSDLETRALSSSQDSRVGAESLERRERSLKAAESADPSPPPSPSPAASAAFFSLLATFSSSLALLALAS